MKKIAAYRLIKPLISASLGLGISLSVSAMPSQHPGYLDSVKDERSLRSVELAIVYEPPKEGAPLKDIIFDDELKREFKGKYEQEFGQTAVERNIEQETRYEGFRIASGEMMDEVEDMERRRRFGEYMVRRLSEHHVDKYIKHNPSTRVVYELKEKISKIQLKVKQGYNLKVNYSYSGNALAVQLKNPINLYNEVVFQMDPDSFGPTDVEETLVSLSWPTSSGVVVSSLYKVNDGIVDLVGSKPISEGVVASVTGSTYTKSEGVSDRENRILFGLTWNN